MVAIVRNENKRQVISELGVDALCGRLARCADYFKVSANGDEYDCSPPPGVVKDILALPPAEWNIPPLDALTEIPIVRPDGSILDTPGYDPATRLYYSPDPSLSIPVLSDTPSSDHIEIALGLIRQAIGEFPYADETSYTNAIAAMLTPIIKPAIDAPAPLAILVAPQAGTGKGLLCDVIAIIATGRAGEMFSASKEAMYQEADDESREWEPFLLQLHEAFYGEPFAVEALGWATVDDRRSCIGCCGNLGSTAMARHTTGGSAHDAFQCRPWAGRNLGQVEYRIVARPGDLA